MTTGTAVGGRALTAERRLVMRKKSARASEAAAINRLGIIGISGMFALSVLCFWVASTV